MWQLVTRMSLVEAERARVRAARASKAREKTKTLLSTLKQLTASIETAASNQDFADASQNAFNLHIAAERLLNSLAISDTEAVRARALELFGLPIVETPAGDCVAVRPAIIYCDPPWAYKNKEHAMGTAGCYPTLEDHEIAALPVSGLAAEHAALLMWVTLPKLDIGIRIMSAWGFAYRTVFLVWDKIGRYFGMPSPATGTYTRTNNELLLLGVRGKLPTMSARLGKRYTSSLRTRPDDHSHKPDIVRKIIVDTFGDLPRIELFARQSPPDWLVWGNEIAGSQVIETTVDANRTEPQARRNMHRGDMIKRNLVTRHGLVPSKGKPADVDKERRSRTTAQPSTLLSLDPYEQWNETTRDTVVYFSAEDDASAEHQNKRRCFEAMLKGHAAREPLSAYLSALDLQLTAPLVGGRIRGSMTYPQLSASELEAALPLIGQIQNENADAIFEFRAKI